MLFPKEESNSITEGLTYFLQKLLFFHMPWRLEVTITNAESCHQKLPQSSNSIWDYHSLNVLNLLRVFSCNIHKIFETNSCEIAKYGKVLILAFC